jgi:hypothetical protein
MSKTRRGGLRPLTRTRQAHIAREPLTLAWSFASHELFADVATPLSDALSPNCTMRKFYIA